MVKNRETATTVNRKARIKTLRLKRKTKSILFLLSLLLNAYALQKYVALHNENKTTVIVKNSHETQRDMVDKIYNLARYKSVSKFSATAQDRYIRLWKAYQEDKQSSKESKYINGELRDDWAKYCRDRVRRIVNLQSRVYDLERVLENMFSGVDNTEMYEQMKSKGYEEGLSEMSNYYAGFLDEYSYNLIVQTTD